MNNKVIDFPTGRQSWMGDFYIERKLEGGRWLCRCRTCGAAVQPLTKEMMMGKVKYCKKKHTPKASEAMVFLD
jgi:hypothetical protein